MKTPVRRGARYRSRSSSGVAGRPDGLTPGTPIPVPLAINFTALPVEPGRRYVWRLAIDDTSEPDWVLTFRVRPVQPA